MRGGLQCVHHPPWISRPRTPLGWRVPLCAANFRCLLSHCGAQFLPLKLWIVGSITRDHHRENEMQGVTVGTTLCCEPCAIHLGNFAMYCRPVHRFPTSDHQVTYLSHTVCFLMVQQLNSVWQENSCKDFGAWGKFFPWQGKFGGALRHFMGKSVWQRYYLTCPSGLKEMCTIAMLDMTCSCNCAFIPRYIFAGAYTWVQWCVWNWKVRQRKVLRGTSTLEQCKKLDRSFYPAHFDSWTM